MSLVLQSRGISLTQLFKGSSYCNKCLLLWHYLQNLSFSHIEVLRILEFYIMYTTNLSHSLFFVGHSSAGQNTPSCKKSSSKELTAIFFTPQEGEGEEYISSRDMPLRYFISVQNTSYIPSLFSGLLLSAVSHMKYIQIKSFFDVFLKFLIKHFE